MIDFAQFRKGVENLLGRELSEEEMTEVVGEPLWQLLKDTLDREYEEKEYAQN